MIVACPAWAEPQETWQEKLKRQLENENVTRAIGSIAGALMGSQIGGGRGKIAAIAVGTLAGYWLAGKYNDRLNNRDRAGIAQATEQAIQSGQTTTWTNPDTGMKTQVSVSEARSGDRDDHNRNKKAPLERMPTLELVNSYYVPSVTINVRGGPDKNYQILHSLEKDTRIPVIGKVAKSEWFLVAENGEASGFVYAPLMKLSEDQSQIGNAIRDSMLTSTPPVHYQVESSKCRRVTQDVVLDDGTADSHTFKVCQQIDGNWIEV